MQNRSILRMGLWALPPLAAIILAVIGRIPISGLLWLACGVGWAELRNRFDARRAKANRHAAVTAAHRAGLNGNLGQ